jgi:hypothetical protein
LPPLFKAFPFKFNPLWIKDQDFIKMVQKLWSDPLYLQETGKQRRLVWKLKDLKAFYKKMAKGTKASGKIIGSVGWKRRYPIEYKIWRRHLQ